MGSSFALNLALATIWCLLFNEPTPSMFVIGFVVGALILYFARLDVEGPFYLRRGLVLGRLGLSFVWELFLANFTVVRQVLSVPLRVTPGIVAYPLSVRSDLAITTLANMITLTPGTLSLDVSADRRTLYIHTLNVEDPDELRRSIRRAFEDYLIDLEGGT